MTSRTFADPPVIPGEPAEERRRRGRTRRHEVPFSAALALPDGVGVTAPESVSVESFVTGLMATPRTDLDVRLVLDSRVRPVATLASPPAASPTLDLVDVDATLPGPFEIDVLLVALRLVGHLKAGASRERRRLQAHTVARDLARGYVEGVDVVATTPHHATRQAAWAASQVAGRRLAARVGKVPPATYESALGRFTSSTSVRLRRGRVSAWAGAEVVEAAPEADRELLQYRETLAEAEATTLAGYRLAAVVDLAGIRGVDRLALLVGSRTDDRLLLHGRAVTASPAEPALGMWRLGSDVQRVLLGRSMVSLVPDELLGWSTSRDGFTARVWSRLREQPAKGSTSPSVSGVRAWARAQGVVLGLVHGRTGDVHALRGYVGGGPGFAEALAAVVSARA